MERINVGEIEAPVAIVKLHAAVPAITTVTDVCVCVCGFVWVCAPFSVLGIGLRDGEG